jgi:hypothetical protein
MPTKPLDLVKAKLRYIIQKTESLQYNHYTLRREKATVSIPEGRVTGFITVTYDVKKILLPIPED